MRAIADVGIGRPGLALDAKARRRTDARRRIRTSSTYGSWQTIAHEMPVADGVRFFVDSYNGSGGGLNELEVMVAMSRHRDNDTSCRRIGTHDDSPNVPSLLAAPAVVHPDLQVLTESHQESSAANSLSDDWATGPF